MTTHLIRLFCVAMMVAPFMPDGCGPASMKTFMRDDGGGGEQTPRASSQSHFVVGGGTTKASSQSHF